MVLVPAVAELRLADVMTSCHSALLGEDNKLGLGPVTKAAVLLVDGLGASNLRNRQGHARWLMSAWGSQQPVLDSGFPSTTASALASLTTGDWPGTHGIVGYTIRDPHSGQLINHLKDWEPTVAPEVWQRSSTVFERAQSEGIACLALGEHRFSGSDFTKAVWRGAQFQGTSGLAEQFHLMREFFDAHDKALVYLYWPALDRTGHSGGVASEAWTRRLEDFDQAVSSLEGSLSADEGLIITADHGMVDVSDDLKMMVGENSELLRGVVAWGGEPRVPQLYIESSDFLDSLVQSWKEAVGDSALVMTREDVISRGLLGDVAPEVSARVGDIVILAASDVAFYRPAVASTQSMAMIGQHGSITPEERAVPLIRLGAWG